MRFPSILIVEDDAAVATLLTEMLRRIIPGAPCHTVKTQATALRHLGQEGSDIGLIILDVFLADTPMNIRNISRVIQATKAPVIVITGIDERWESDAFYYGAAMFFFKPDLEFPAFKEAVLHLLHLPQEGGSAPAPQ